MNVLKIITLFLTISFSSFAFANDTCVAGRVQSYSALFDGFFSAVNKREHPSTCRIAIIAHSDHPAYKSGFVDLSKDSSRVHMFRTYVGRPSDLRLFKNEEIYRLELSTVSNAIPALKKILMKAGQSINADYSKCLVTVLYALPAQEGIRDQLVQGVSCE